jgi:Flp pilus assembly protein TadD
MLSGSRTLVLALLLFAPAGAWAMMTDEQPAPAAASEYAVGKRLVESNQYAAAIPHLQRAVKQNPEDANAYNLLGFSQRKTGNLDAAFAAYGRALAIDPAHRQAREYLGEAYLQAGDLAKAQEQLAAIASICKGPRAGAAKDAWQSGCEEWRDLKADIVSYKSAHR